MKKRETRKSVIVWMVMVSVIILMGVFVWQARVYDVPVKVKQINSGNTIVVSTGETVKLAGVDLSKVGGEGSMLAKDYLSILLDGRNVWLDRGQEGSRVWIGCESSPKLLISKMIFLRGNPLGCKKGVLVNEQVERMSVLK